MNFLNKAMILLSFLLAAVCTSAYVSSKEEVIFIREYREYGLQEYDKTGSKLAYPTQILKDFYLVEYRLSADNLTIAKVSESHMPTRVVLFTAMLSGAQRQTVQQIIRNANFDLIQHQCNSNTVIIDDGFHLNVTLTKSGVSKRFEWNGNYIPELLELVNITNKISPDKYKFYEPSKQEAFKQSLLQATSNP